jgi:hypothetical protein
MDLTDIHTIFYPAAAQYTFFSTALGTFSKKTTKQVLTNTRNLK